jgi:YD repeat-containing protein
MIHRRKLSIVLTLVMAVVLLTAPFSLLAQQSGTTRYVYDDNGRLRAVILPTGEVAVYEYDAAGNITAIRRPGANTIEFLSFFPHAGGAGDLVTILGSGIGPGYQSVTFNSVTAAVIQATSSVIIAAVPDAATTGLIRVNMPGGTLQTPTPFTVLPHVRITPASPIVMINATVQLSAAVTPLLTDQSVTWSVNGINGGNATVGTISASGLYLAPNQTINAIVRATSVATPTLFGETTARVRDANGFGILASSTISVSHGAMGSVLTERPVSVLNGRTLERSLGQSAPVSVLWGRRLDQSVGQSSPVSVTTGPVITGVASNQLARGGTITLTLSGSNLDGATALRFINANGTLDMTITVSNLNVNASGDRLTATVTVSAGAALGQRIVMVEAAAGTSLTANAGANVVQVTQ